MSKIGIILQARMGSTRLPGKVLMNVGTRPLLSHIIDKIKVIKDLTLVVATTIDSKDDQIVDFCNKNKISVFRGSEHDVLERYYLCAKEWQFENIVRLTADNPFVDIEELLKMIDFFFESQVDYVDNFSSLPIGVGSEVFNFKSLERSYREGLLDHHREHVNEYIIENSNIFKKMIFTSSTSKNFPSTRLTIDTPLDLRRANYICQKNGNDFVTIENAIKFAQDFDSETA